MKSTLMETQKNIHFRTDRQKWGYRFVRRGIKYQRYQWNTAEEASIAFEAFRKGFHQIGGKPESDTLIGTLGGPQFALKMSDLSAHACVYAIVREGRILYIGSSVNGILRSGDHSHHIRPMLSATDTVLIWQYGSLVRARKIEAEMILKFKPQFNYSGIPGKRHRGRNLCL